MEERRGRGSEEQPEESMKQPAFQALLGWGKKMGKQLGGLKTGSG